MNADLFHRQIGEEGDALLILHGLFGSSDNWQTLGKQWAKDYRVYFIDQRNHGRSEHTLIHGYDSMAEDLEAFMDQEDIEVAHLLGHSMGGKTVMRFAQMFDDRVKSLIVADMGIREYPPHHQTIIEALNSFDPAQINSRTVAEEYLRRFIDQEGVIQFLLKNLYRLKEGGYAWRFNLPVLEASMPDILEELPSLEVDSPSFFLRGANSNYVADQDWAEIQELFPNSELGTIGDAGHWLHADQPAEFHEQVRNFLIKNS